MLGEKIVVKVVAVVVMVVVEVREKGRSLLLPSSFKACNIVVIGRHKGE